MYKFFSPGFAVKVSLFGTKVFSRQTGTAWHSATLSVSPPCDASSLRPSHNGTMAAPPPQQGKSSALVNLLLSSPSLVVQCMVLFHLQAGSMQNYSLKQLKEIKDPYFLMFAETCVVLGNRVW